MRGLSMSLTLRRQSLGLRGGIQGHEQGAVIEIACRIDQPRHFLRAEHDGQAPGRLRKGNVLGQKMPA